MATDLLAFDGRTGAAGDMVLGALVAAGADPAVLAPVEDALGVTYEVAETERNGIAAVDVTVRTRDGPAGNGAGDGTGAENGTGDGSGAEGGSDHDDGYDHDHDHDDGYDHDHDHAEGGGPTRTYPEVVAVVESMGLPAGVEADALAIVELLGAAEAAVHGTDLDATTFHEVGADDAVADVVGAALLVADVDPDRVVTTPLAAGGGEVDTAHGTYPVPAPAVVELAERADWELRGGPVEAELLTPTGAAVLAHFAEGVDSVPAMRVTDSGYGAGDRELADRPNVLRAVRGEARGLEREPIAVLETNLDDATPEVLGGLQETLTAAGALDVSVVPLTAKKSRPGHLVKAIVRPEDAERVAHRLAVETGTLGVRQAGARHRFRADRRVETVPVRAGGRRHEVDVKVAAAGGQVFDVSAEYDDALAVATETGLAVREVMRRAEAAARSSGADGSGADDR